MTTSDRPTTGPPRVHRASSATQASTVGMRNAVDGHPMPAAQQEATLSSNELAAMRTDLALYRNLLAADRTLMAWVRTSLSLLSFGFTIYKVLEGFQATGANLPRDATPRDVGMFLSALGTIAMVMGTLEYWDTLRSLRRLEDFRIVRAPLGLAVFMSAMGVFLFLSIVVRLF